MDELTYHLSIKQLFNNKVYLKNLTLKLKSCFNKQKENFDDYEIKLFLTYYNYFLKKSKSKILVSIKYDYKFFINKVFNIVLNKYLNYSESEKTKKLDFYFEFVNTVELELNIFEKDALFLIKYFNKNKNINVYFKKEDLENGFGLDYGKPNFLDLKPNGYYSLNKDNNYNFYDFSSSFNLLYFIYKYKTFLKSTILKNTLKHLDIDLKDYFNNRILKEKLDNIKKDMKFKNYIIRQIEKNSKELNE